MSGELASREPAVRCVVIYMPIGDTDLYSEEFEGADCEETARSWLRVSQDGGNDELAEPFAMHDADGNETDGRQPAVYDEMGKAYLIVIYSDGSTKIEPYT